MLKSMIYKVELPDSQVKGYAEKVNAKNMLLQVHEEGYRVNLVDSIVGYKRYDSAVDKAEN